MGVRRLIAISVLALLCSCSTSKCYPDCVQGYEPIPNGCGCRPVQDAGGLDTPADQTDGGDSGSALASCEPAAGCGTGSTCIEGCPSSARPSIGSAPGICSVPGRDTCGCGAVLDPCTTPGTACLMPACCDYEGICVTPAERASICARPEGAHFDCSPVDAGRDSSIDDSSIRDSSINDGPATGDSGAPCDPQTLAAAIRMVTMQAGLPSSCASPLPPTDAADANGARNATRAFLAATLAVPPEALMVTALPCGGEVGATCASHFNHDLYKSNGTLADALLPSAKNIESCAVYIEETIWTAVVNGVTGPAEVCVSGVTPTGKLIGIAFFNDRMSCP